MHKQRSLKKLASGFIVASVMIGAALFTDLGSTTQAPSGAKCQQLSSFSEGTQDCATQVSTNELSWFSWLTGKSRSTQFHFLDLFELLFADADHSQNNYGNTKKVSIG